MLPKSVSKYPFEFYFAQRVSYSIPSRGLKLFSSFLEIEFNRNGHNQVLVTSLLAYLILSHLNMALFADALHVVRLGDHLRLQTMLSSKILPDINMEDASGQTLLMTATANGQLECVRVLLDNGAAVDWPFCKVAGEDTDTFDPSSKKTALNIACEKGYKEIVKMLLERKANPNLGYDNPSLYVACFKGELEIAKLLIEHGATLGNDPGVDDRSEHGSYIITLHILRIIPLVLL